MSYTEFHITAVGKKTKQQKKKGRNYCTLMFFSLKEILLSNLLTLYLTSVRVKS